MSRLKLSLWLMISFCTVTQVRAQGLLGKSIMINANQQKLSSVLAMMEKEGGFKFSYQSTIVALDSLVDFKANNLSIEESLNRLLKNQYEFKQANNFIIIRYAPLHLSLVLQESSGNQSQYLIRGKIINEQSLKPLANASVYEKNLLQSTLTDEQGLFTLKLKNIDQTISLTINKENYKEVTSYFLPEITIIKDKKPTSNSFVAGELDGIEKTFLGRMLITAKQKTQSVNIGSFIASAPAQISLGPGLGTHGLLSGQVVNKFSINITGDYNAGVDGMEIGFLYNIDKKNVRYFQFGGAFNLVGGQFTGLQVAGFYNNVLQNFNGIQVTLGYNHLNRTFKGLQIGALYNHVGQEFHGVQTSLLYNQVKRSVKGVQMGAVINNAQSHLNGVQIASLYNRVKNDLKGIQIGPFNQSQNLSRGVQFSLLGNWVNQRANGLQLAGLFNYAKQVKGLQIGLINVADSSSGYHLGLINIVKKGYHQLNLSTNETIDFNIALKTGSKQLYTQLLFGQNLNRSKKLIAMGWGLGKEITLAKNLSLNPELSSRYLHQGDWMDTTILNRIDLNLNYRIHKHLAINAGPAFNLYYSNQKNQIPNYDFVNTKSPSLGWSMGLSFL